MTVEHYIDIYREDPTLRVYQQQAKNAIFEAWDRIDSVMFQMPTGTGKTRLFTSIINDINRYSIAIKQPVKIIVIAHRTELIDQIDESLGKYNIAHGIIAGGRERNLKMPVQVASIQTITNPHNIDDAKKLNADFLIIDEAHHSLARTYKSLWDLYPKAKRLGVTATPWRMSGNGFTGLFDDLIMSWPVKKYIDEGYLSHYNYYSLKQSSDISKQIDTINEFNLEGDYKVSAMEHVMNTSKIRAQLLDAYLTLAEGKKGIIYAISQAHSKKICQEYAARGIKIATIDSQTPVLKRKQIVNDFRQGKITIIVNVDIFSEGFDCPDIEFVQLARPTCSLAKYLQQVGRALRPTEQKSHAIILDNVGMYQRFGLPDARRYWRHHFIGDNSSTEEVQQKIQSIGDGAGSVLSLKEGHEDMVLIQQTADILDVEENVPITKEFKLGPITYQSGFVWNDPKHRYSQGIHYFEDIFKRKFCMYADEKAIWHFERILNKKPIMVRQPLIGQRVDQTFSFECNIARISGTYLSYKGLHNYNSDASLQMLDFWNPEALKDEDPFVCYCREGDKLEGERIEEYSSKIYEQESTPQEEKSPLAIAMGKAFDSIIGIGDNQEGLPVALMSYSVKREKDGAYIVVAQLNNGINKVVFKGEKDTDFARSIANLEDKNIPYCIFGFLDREALKKKNKLMVFSESENEEEAYLQFDPDGNFYDEKKSSLNPTQSTPQDKPKMTLQDKLAALPDKPKRKKHKKKKADPAPELQPAPAVAPTKRVRQRFKRHDIINKRNQDNQS